MPKQSGKSARPGTKRAAPKAARKGGGGAKLLLVILFLIAASVGVYWFTTPPEQKERHIDLAKRYASELIDQAHELIEGAAAPDETGTTTYSWAGDGESYVFAGIPKSTDYAHPVTVLENTGFIVGYCEYKKNPVWVSYRIHREDNARAPPRPSRFTVDARTRAQVRHEDYTNSGFDRGHMAPNHAIGSRYGREAQLQTFQMSNIAPQSPRLNRDTWRLLEERIANDYTRRYNNVWTIVGPVYGHPVQRLPSGVAIPDAFFKLIVTMDGAHPKGLAFVVPQDVTGREPFRQFLTSIAEVQRLTGFDFFWELEDDFEEFFEAATAVDLW